MTFFQNNIKIKLIILYTVFVFTCLNSYLSYNNLAIYSHATDDFAILNIRWGMSPKQVELATNKTLDEEYLNKEYKIYSHKLKVVDRARLSGNVQGHMAVSPRIGKWRYIWHKQLKKRG